MDPLHFCIAMVPLAVYLLMLGLLNLRRTPFVTSGARDAAAVGIGYLGAGRGWAHGAVFAAGGGVALRGPRLVDDARLFTECWSR